MRLFGPGRGDAERPKRAGQRANTSADDLGGTSPHKPADVVGDGSSGTSGGPENSLRTPPATDAELAAQVDATVSEYPTSLCQHRIQSWLEGAGFAFFVDSDGDLGGIWHNRIFYLLTLGGNQEVLQVRGQWNRECTLDYFDDLLEVCNTWNAERIWPKAYLRVRDDGTVVVCADLTIDVEHGATDAQLDQLLRCGLATGTAFFDRMDAEYPDPLTVRKPA